jgi:hypothetical protein
MLNQLKIYILIVFGVSLVAISAYTGTSTSTTAIRSLKRVSTQSSAHELTEVIFRVPKVSGISVDFPEIKLYASAIMSVEEAQKKVTPAIEVLDADGTNVPVTVQVNLDDSGMKEISVLPDKKLKNKNWYRLYVFSSPPDVILSGGDEEWTVDFYTGNLFQIASIRQADAPKNDTLYVRMTEEIDFDKKWAERLFFDDEYNAVPGCVQLDDECTNSGVARVREVSVLLQDPSAGTRISRLAPIDSANGPSATERKPINFKSCHNSHARCYSVKDE